MKRKLAVLLMAAGLILVLTGPIHNSNTTTYTTNDWHGGA